MSGILLLFLILYYPYCNNKASFICTYVIYSFNTN